MLRQILLALAAATALAGCQPTGRMPPQGRDTVVQARIDDAALLRARSQARATLPRFLSHSDSPPAGWSNLGVKVAVPGRETIEHIWVGGFARSPDGRFAGRLVNQPMFFRGRMGDLILFDQSQITDWSVEIGGREYGNYGTRAMLTRLPAEQQALLGDLLSDRPLPPQW